MAKLTSGAPAAAVNIKGNDASPSHKIGERIETADGRMFRYCYAGATALVPGKVYDAPTQVSNHTNIAVAAAAAIGATSVTVTLGATAATLNQYAGGYLVVNDVTGEGYTYAIKSNPAADASASLVLTLEADDPIRVALTTSSEVSLVPNPYNGLVIHATTEVAIPVGIAVTAITANYYGWVQTHGVVSALHNDNTAIGQSVVASDTTTAGGVEVGDGILPVIGYAIATGVATEYNPIFLTID